MRITKGKVIDGQMVTDERTFTLSQEEESALLEAIAEADQGELIDADDVLKRLP